MKTLWSLLLGAVVFASALSSVPGALGAPSGDTSCSAAGSGTTFSIDLIIPASALPQQGVAIGIQGGTVTAISIDGYQGTFSTSGLPAGASGEELVSQAFSTGTIVIHVTLSAAPTSSVIVIFPTNSPPSSYFDMLNCPISSSPTGGTSSGTPTPTAPPSNSFKPYDSASWDPRHMHWNQWTVVPGPGTLSWSDPPLSRTAASRHEATPLIKPGKVIAAKAGDVTVPLVPTAAGKTAIKSTGSIKIALKLTFTPTGGQPSTKTIKLTLREKP